MKLLRYILCFLACAISFSGLANKPASSAPENFTGLVSNGTIPECFRTLSVDKYLSDKKEIDKDDSRFERKSKDAFFLQSNYIIDRILLSGKVTYGDSITEYINDVADYLLKDHPKLRKELNFFTTKSQYANAFATDQGIIFVNTGLLARLHSEAELAFVLAHEITHYVEKHVINLHLEKDKMIKQKGAYRGVSFNDNYLNYNMMSKEHESEADEKAYEEYYKNSNYCLDELDSAFQTLLYSQMPFYEIAFSNDIFETEFYKFPKSYTAETVDTVSYASILEKDEDEEDESTHPATVKRKKAIARLKVKENNDGREKFVVSKERFLYARNLSRMESVRQMMVDRHYIDAIYNCIAMLELFPDNRFYEKTLASALYLYSRHYTEEVHYDIEDYYSRQSTEIKQLVHFLNEIGRDELTVLALKYVSEIAVKHGVTDHDRLMAEHLMDDLFFEHKVKNKELFTKEELLANISLNDPNDDKNDTYYLNAFVQLEENEFFTSLKQEYVEKCKKHDEQEAADKHKSVKQKRKEDRLARKQKVKKERYERKHGLSLGEEKVVVVDPFYYKIKPRSKMPLQLVESEQKQLRFCDRIDRCGEASPLEVDVLNPKSFASTDINHSQNFSMLSDWFDERLEFEETLDVVPYCSSQIDNTRTMYGTNNVMWTGVVSEKIKKKVGANLIGAIVLTYGIAIPFVCTWALIPSYDTGYFSLLYDIATGEQKMGQFKLMRTTDLSGDFVNKISYDTFYQIYRKPKK